MDFTKKHTNVTGEIVFPLQVGARARLYDTFRGIILTSTVVSIFRVDTKSVVFETENTIYSVSFAPTPEPAAVMTSSVLAPFKLAAA